MFHVKHWTKSLQDDFNLAVKEVNTIGLGKYGDEEFEKLKQYIDLLLFWSKRINLIAKNDRDNLTTKHILPALEIIPLIRALPHKTIMDFGSGAGIPGIPLKIYMPEVDFILLESRRKRAHFLREVNQKLDLKNITVVNQRIEQIKALEKVELVVTRAAADANELFPLVRPHLKSYGNVVSYLSRNMINEKKSRDVRVLYQRQWVGSSNATVGLLWPRSG